jgi:Na+/H+ antiporter NhaA
MTGKRPGVIALCLLATSVIAGLYGISRYSMTAAGIYLVGGIIVWLVFVYAFCAKCQVHDQCNHVVMGLVAGMMPKRAAGPYTRVELLAVFLFFAFVALFPLYWLIRQRLLLVVFLVLFAGNLVLTHFTCCKGCGNRFCMLRYE